MNEWQLAVQGVTAGYEKPLVKRITFTLKKGQILTLIGPNGAGKTTVLKTLTRQLRQLAGTVVIDGRNFFSLKAGEAAQRLSIVSTSHEIPEMTTCYDIVALGRYPHIGRLGILSSDDHDVIRRCMQEVKVWELREKEYAKISDGQRQRILVARALCQQPEVLVLDEPTSYLDIKGKIEILDILQHMTREDKLTVVISLHEIELAQKISDLVLCIGADHSWTVGKPEEVFTEQRIRTLFGLEEGIYLPGSGIELRKPAGKPCAFVVAGGGYGIPYYRKLQRKGIGFYAGILYEYDWEARIAEQLALNALIQRGFEMMDGELIHRAKDAILECGMVIDAGTPVGALNQPNAELIRFASELKMPIVRSLNELD